MIEILNNELKITNQDIKTEILENLILFIKNTRFNIIEKRGNIFIKFKEFEYIFQKLVDSIGIQGNEKKQYYPRAEYCYFREKNKLKMEVSPSLPDTINAFVLPRDLKEDKVKIEDYYATTEDMEERKVFVVYVDTKKFDS